MTLSPALATHLAAELAAADPWLAGRALSGVAAHEAAMLLRHLAPAARGTVLSSLDPAMLPAVVDALGEAAVDALARLDAPEQARLLRALPEGQRTALLAALPRGRVLRRLLHYPQDTVGSIMTAPVPILEPHETAGRARALLARASIPVIAVVDRSRRPIGWLDGRALLTAASARPVGALAGPPPRVVFARAALDDLLDAPEWVEHAWLPVVDHQGAAAGALSLGALHRWERSRGGRGEGQASDLLSVMGSLLDAGAGLIVGLMARNDGEAPTRPSVTG